MEKNKLDDIYSLLDEVTSEKEEETATTRKSNPHPDLASIGRTINEGRTVRKPALPKIDEFTNRLDCFEKMLNGVDFGTRNSTTYVEGYREALDKYLNEAQDNPKNLFIVEGKVSAEITDYSRVNKSSLYSKGYYDGLTYVYKALKSSKVQTAAKIYKILKREIG